MKTNEAEREIDAPDTRRRRHSLSRRLLLGMFSYVVIAVAALPHFVPPLPKSVTGWVLLLVFAPPIYILGEWIGDKISGEWGEHSRPAKLAKACLFVLGGLAVILLNAVCRGGYALIVAGRALHLVRVETEGCRDYEVLCGRARRVEAQAVR